MLIWDMLSAGADRAISKAVLADMLGTDERTIRAKVHAERAAGYPIISSVDHAGYYRPAVRADLERFAHSMRHRAAETYIIAEAARAALDAYDGQARLF